MELPQDPNQIPVDREYSSAHGAIIAATARLGLKVVEVGGEQNPAESPADTPLHAE